MNIFKMLLITLVSIGLMGCSSKLKTEKQIKKTTYDVTAKKLITYEKDPDFGVPVYVKQLSLFHEKTILLVHGLGTAASTDWLKLESFLKKDYHIISVDLPGFGKSKGNLKANPSPKAYSKVLKRIVDKYKHSEQIILMGHSMGAATSLYFLNQYPELVEKSVLIAVAGVLERTVYAKELSVINSDPESKKGVFGSYKNMFNSFVNNVSDWGLETATKTARATRRVRRKLFPQDGKIRKGFINMVAALGLIETDFSHIIRSIDSPVLLIWGKKDKIASIRVSQILNKQINKSKLIYFNQLGHTPHIIKPKLVFKKINTWLNNPSYEVSPVIPASDKTYVCRKSEKKKVVTGSYNEMVFDRCRNVIVRDVTARKVILIDSDIVIENMNIFTDRLALELYRSNLKATNLFINAPEVINLKDSKVDIAGAEINYKYSLIDAIDSRVRWSVGFTRKENEKGFAQHGEDVYD